MNLISSGGLRPPQHQVEYKSSLIIIEFAALVAAEAGDLRYYINLSSYKGRRTQSDRAADAIRSDGGRNLIGRRTESDRAANGIRSDGERNPIGRRTESDRAADATR